MRDAIKVLVKSRTPRTKSGKRECSSILDLKMTDFLCILNSNF